MKVDIDDKSGFCFGVVKAITAAEEAVARSPIVSLGDIVHNPIEMRRLEGLGLRSVEHGELGRMRGGRVLIRAHGEPPATYETARRNGIEVVDATCPVVARLQKLVREAHAQMKSAGGRIVILGKKGHAEVEGLLGQVDGDALVVERVQDLDALDFTRPIYLLSQTTKSPALFEEVAERIRGRVRAQVVIRNTICREVAGREKHMEEFAGGHDVVVFVSGRNSSNGRALFDVCLRANPSSHMVEHGGELQKEWFEGARSAGICGATSTPRWLMESVGERIAQMAACENAAGEASSGK